MKKLMKHINTGKIREMDLEIAKDFIGSPSWVEVDKQGNPIQNKKQEVKKVYDPPIFVKPKERQTKSAT